MNTTLHGTNTIPQTEITNDFSTIVDKIEILMGYTHDFLKMNIYEI